MIRRQVCTFLVDGPPVPKGRPRLARSGHTYTPPRTVQAEQTIAFAARLAMKSFKPLERSCGVAIRAFLPTRRRVDIDNLAKTVLDACNGIVYQDDAYIVELEVRKYLAQPQPRLEVRVWTVEETTST